jgi:hypothetical protein
MPAPVKSDPLQPAGFGTHAERKPKLYYTVMSSMGGYELLTCPDCRLKIRNRPSSLGSLFRLTLLPLLGFSCGGHRAWGRGQLFLMAILAVRTGNHAHGGLHEKKVFHPVHTERFGSVVRI